MTTYNSTQYQKTVDNKLMNLPAGGGKMTMFRARYKVPAGGLAVADKISFGLIKPGYKFNPAEARVHWTVGTATSALNLGHTGFSNIDDDGIVSDIAADDNEFVVAADLGTANLAGTVFLNARVGGIYVSDRDAAGDKVDGLLVQATIATAGMPANQEIVVEIPLYAA